MMQSRRFVDIISCKVAEMRFLGYYNLMHHITIMPGKTWSRLAEGFDKQ